MAIKTKRSISIVAYEKQEQKIMERLEKDPSKIAELVRNYCCESLTREDRAQLVKQAKSDRLELRRLVGEYMESKYSIIEYAHS